MAREWPVAALRSFGFSRRSGRPCSARTSLCRHRIASRTRPRLSAAGSMSASAHSWLAFARSFATAAGAASTVTARRGTAMPADEGTLALVVRRRLGRRIERTADARERPREVDAEEGAELGQQNVGLREPSLVADDEHLGPV